MASFRPLTLNPNGHDALLDAADNLTLENAPQADTDAANKLYVDTEIDTAETNLTADYDAKIQAEEDARIDADNQLQANIDAEATTRATEDAALQEQINLINGDEPGSDNPYVKRTGDDMTGDLTLGTDKITLNSSEGSITNDGYIFNRNAKTPASAGSSTGSSAGLYLNNMNSSSQGTRNDSALVISDETGGTGNNISLNYDGSCSFAGSGTFTGSLEAASIDGGTY